MAIEIKDKKYLGVSVDSPDIKNACRNMRRNGASLDEIQRVVGMPREVIERHVREFERETKGGKDSENPFGK